LNSHQFEIYLGELEIELKQHFNLFDFIDTLDNIIIRQDHAQDTKTHKSKVAADYRQSEQDS
jgi:ABC-type uncharacterized transport system ATPase subunit